MAKIYHSRWSALKYLIAITVVLLATNNVFGQFFVQGGSSYWPSFNVPQLTLYDFPLGNRDDGTVERRTDLWLGAGFRVDEAWSFEGFFSKLPSTEVNVDLFSIYGGRPILPQNVSISVNTDTTTIGFGAVYDLYINERISFIVAKAGVAFTQQDVDVDASFPRFRGPPIYFGDDDFDDLFDIEDLFEDFVYDEDYYDDLIGDDESTLDMYFAVGVRLPIQDSPASVTATYQFISTPRDSESGLYVGICWQI